MNNTKALDDLVDKYMKDFGQEFLFRFPGFFDWAGEPGHKAFNELRFISMGLVREQVFELNSLMKPEFVLSLYVYGDERWHLEVSTRLWLHEKDWQFLESSRTLFSADGKDRPKELKKSIFTDLLYHLKSSRKLFELIDHTKELEEWAKPHIDYLNELTGDIWCKVNRRKDE